MSEDTIKEEIELSTEELAENQSKVMEQLARMQESGLLGRKTDPLEGVDIDSEFQLVQEKKSKLSASKRRMVCARHAYFQEVEERRLTMKESENDKSEEEE